MTKLQHLFSFALAVIFRDRIDRVHGGRPAAAKGGAIVLTDSAYRQGHDRQHQEEGARAHAA